MSISFNSIPVNLRTPGVFIEYDNSRAVQGSPPVPNVALIIGLRLSTGVNEGTVEEAVPTMVASKEKGETYFGHGSELAQMIEKFKNANAYTELWAIALDEGAGVNAAGTFTFAGTSTEAGSVYTYIGGERVVTAIPSGTAHTAVGPLVDADITAFLLTSNMPVAPSVLAEVVTITALHKGTNGNKIDLQLGYNAGETLPAGLTCTVAQMSAGATDPTIATAIAVFSDVWYTTIVSSLSDDTNQDLLEAELLTRWGPMRMQDGMSFIGVEGNQGTLTTAGNLRNSQFTNLMGAGLSPTPEWLWAAVTAAIDSAEPDPARPRQTLLLPGLMAPLPADQFDNAEQNILLTDGVSTYLIGQDGKIYIQRLITTYQTNALSLPDPSYLNVTTMRTLAYLRYTLRLRIALKYPRHKLADNGSFIPPGQPIVTPELLKTEAIALFLDTWVPMGVVEGASLEQFKTDAIFERNLSDVDRVDFKMSPDLMNQFRIGAGQIQFIS